MAPSKIICVMGITGAGKSSLIKLITRDESIQIGNSLNSETTEVKSYETCIGGETYTLVDTPGFDGTHASDSDILEALADWLAKTYRDGSKLHGVIYLHPITDARMRGLSIRGLNTLRDLCGENFYRNIILATSCWSLVPEIVGIAREKELVENKLFWGNLIAHGAMVVRIPDNRAAARRTSSEGAAREVENPGNTFRAEKEGA
ncbi:hypothetical protein ABW19_dt0200758 [Dactylella cylindrospora]|nr:hypothetical protein ABW19_dt0200758 [Dactylella cylindrospora]